MGVPGRDHPHRVFRAVGEAGNRVARGRPRRDRGLPVAGVVALSARHPLHRVARGVAHRRPGHHQLRVARGDPHPHHLGKVRHWRRRRWRRRHSRRPRHSHRRRAVVGAGPGRDHPHRVFRAVGEAGNRVARGRPRRDRGLPVAGVVALSARHPLHRVARGVAHRRPGHHQLRVARGDPHPHHLGKGRHRRRRWRPCRQAQTQRDGVAGGPGEAGRRKEICVMAGGYRCGAEVKIRRADMQPQHGLLPGRESGIGRGKGQHVPHQRHLLGRVVVRTDGEGLVVQTAEALALEPEHASEGRIGGHGHRTGPDHVAAAQGGDGADGHHRRRRRAGQRLRGFEIVGEAHPHLEGLAQFGVDQGVGRVGRVGDVHRVRGAVGVHPDPLVRVGGAGQPVVIHDAGGDRRQRLAHLRRARDGRRARRGGVGRIVVGHRHLHAGDRDALVVAVRTRRAVGQRDRLVRHVRIGAGRHRHRLGRAPGRRREGQAGRIRGHVRARVPGDRHRDSRRGLAVEDHRVGGPGRVLLGHRQRRRRHRDARQRIVVGHRHLHAGDRDALVVAVRTRRVLVLLPQGWTASRLARHGLLNGQPSCDPALDRSQSDSFWNSVSGNNRL